MIRRIVTTAAVATLAIGAAACNTVEGAGEDIESVAEEVDEEF